MIVITSDTLRPNLEDFERVPLEVIDTILDYWATRAVTEMRLNASWTDRTTNARNGLAARRFSEDDGASLVLFHTMPYGIWLEVRWSGRYAIIGPTLNDIAPRVLQMVGQGVLQATAL